MNKTKPKAVELVKSSYRPTKYEIEESFSVHKKGGGEPTLEDLAKTHDASHQDSTD